jgi:plastocyanin
MSRSPRPLVVSLLALSIVAAGCGGGGGGKKSAGKQPASGSKSAAVNIRESEYKLNPANPKIAHARAVAFRVTNQGKITHALAVKGPNGAVRTSAIKPGSSATLNADLSKPGTYEFYCPIDGHRKLGMAGQVIVTGGGKSGSSSSTQSAPSKGGGGGGGGY